MNKKIYTYLGIIFLLVIWLVLSLTSKTNIAFPSIMDTFSSLGKLLTTASTYKAILFTFTRLIIAISISFVISLLLGVLSYLSTKFEHFIIPFITIMRTTPVAAIIIILLLLVGDNSTYIITSFMVIPIMYEGILTSFKNIDSNIVDEVKMVSKISLKIVWKVYIPLSFPYILSSLIQSVGLGLKVLVMSEFIVQPKNSIGYMLFQDRASLEMSNVFAWTIILITIVLVIDFLIKKMKKTAI